MNNAKNEPLIEGAWIVPAQESLDPSLKVRLSDSREQSLFFIEEGKEPLFEEKQYVGLTVAQAIALPLSQALSGLEEPKREPAKLPRIIGAEIEPPPKTILGPMPRVKVFLDNETEKELFSFYPDEISFRPEEFIGLTVSEAYKLKGDKDRAYLRSKAKPPIEVGK